MQTFSNKNKIINDPVYGFVNINSALLFDLIETPVFQRLRRIKQLGLSNLVYPGALHTRFQHVIGAMSLAVQAVEVLKSKGVNITNEEKDAVCAAVLLHDIGHGPFSHTLEQVLVKNVHHEKLSLAFMQQLNLQFNGKLDKCIQIFTNQYPRKFLHQLVSSQLDMDRLDYLRRDSFYTGVQEGVIGHDRIINMLNVVDDELVIDEKGIYSIEKFLIARRLMYWQVYLHKTVVAAESVLVKIMERASLLASNKVALFASPDFSYFLYHLPGKEEFLNNPEVLKRYSKLDDHDIFSAIKVWCDHDDLVLSDLCKQLRDRELPRIELRNEPFTDNEVQFLKEAVAKDKGISFEEAGYYVFTDSVSNKAYSPDGFNIKVMYKNGNTADIATASDQYNISALALPVTKYFLCYPKIYKLPRFN
ncbi:MAG: HD domain-containing protein [Bacteroidetes bacterium]|nr:MAG: HD domain-containing protein [Bacteroidota bacterium]